MFNLILINLTEHMQWVLLMMPVASHDQNYQIPSPFDHFDLNNGMVPLITLLASCHTDTSINGIQWPEKSCCTFFQLSWPNEYSGAIDITWYWCQCQVSNDQNSLIVPCFDHLELTNMMALLMVPSVSCDANIGITWPRKSCFILFKLSWIRRQDGAIDHDMW